jgi:hypothetical protein
MPSKRSYLPESITDELRRNPYDVDPLSDIPAYMDFQIIPGHDGKINNVKIGNKALVFDKANLDLYANSISNACADLLKAVKKLHEQYLLRIEDLTKLEDSKKKNVIKRFFSSWFAGFNSTLDECRAERENKTNLAALSVFLESGEKMIAERLNSAPMPDGGTAKSLLRSIELSIAIRKELQVILKLSNRALKLYNS